MCIPNSSMRENLIKEKHSGGLAGHFGIDKTVALVSEQYFWPQIHKDFKRCVQSCRVCQVAKVVVRMWDCINL